MRQGSRLNRRLLLTVAVLAAAGIVTRDQLHRALARAVEQREWARAGKLSRFGVSTLTESDRYALIEQAATRGDARLLEMLLRNYGVPPAPARLSTALDSAITSKQLECI